MGNLILENGLVNNLMLYLILEDDGFFDTVPTGIIKGTYITKNGELLAVVDMSGGSNNIVDQLVFIKHEGIGNYSLKEHKMIEV